MKVINVLKIVGKSTCKIKLAKVVSAKATIP